MGILELNLKQVVGFHLFELIYLAVLAILPFIVSLRYISTCCIMLLVVLLVISLYKKFSFKKIEVKGQGVVITGCDTGTVQSLCITSLLAYCKGGNFNIHIWVWFGYFSC